jgi:nucleoside-diphosphate-sugar epimerase
MILVTGAGGNVGGAVAAELAARKVPVRVLVRHAAKAAAFGGVAPKGSVDVRGLVEQFVAYRAGQGTAVSGDVEAVTGTPPQSYLRWAEAHRFLFA